MGALFNTRNTLTILKFLNAHYYPGNPFNHARNNGEHNVLRDFGNYPTSYDCAHQLGLHDPSVNARWQRWLNYLDSYQQGFSYGGLLVRTMMADALDPAKSPYCNGIEFFAVPASGFSVMTPPPQVPDPQQPNLYTVEIIVETDVIDNMISFTAMQRPRP